MRMLTKYELGAMWLYGKEYAESGLNAIDYWEALPGYQAERVRDMVDELDEAPYGTSPQREET